MHHRFNAPCRRTLPATKQKSQCDVGRARKPRCINFLAFAGNVKPFVLYTVTNGDEAMDIGNRGFALAYTQNACPLVVQWKTTQTFWQLHRFLVFVSFVQINRKNIKDREIGSVFLSVVGRVWWRTGCCPQYIYEWKESFESAVDFRCQMTA